MDRQKKTNKHSKNAFSDTGRTETRRTVKIWLSNLWTITTLSLYYAYEKHALYKFQNHSVFCSCFESLAFIIMKAIFALLLIVAIIAMAMAEALPEPERIFDAAAHGADVVASGVKNFFG